MGKEKTLIAGILCIDIILLTIVVLGSYLVVDFFFPIKTNHITSVSSMLVTYIISFLASYSIFPSLAHERISKTEEMAKRVLITCSLTLLFITLITTLVHTYESFPRTFYLLTIGIYSILLFLERLTLRRYLMKARAHKKNQKKIIFIGNEPIILSLYKKLSRPSYGYDVVGCFYDGNCDDSGYESVKIGGTADIYGWLAGHTEVNEIYGYFPKEQQDLIKMVSKFCDNHLIRFYYVPAIDVFKSSMDFHFIENIPVLARREEPLLNPINKAAKRMFDILFSGAVLVTIFPLVLIFVSIMIKLKSPGPIFFKQDRTGLDGKVFKCIKFRSMKVNKDADTVQATKNDPRKFPFGDFMRKTNIDELPQFINVFIGDMSIVGPRPHMLRHTEEYSKLINRFMVRHLAKPGITGLAQVSGFRGETRYIDQMEGRVKKDIEYIENWTFLLDLKIIIKTVTNMFGKEKGNAY